MKTSFLLCCSLAGMFHTPLIAGDQMIETAVKPLLQTGDPVAISIGIIKNGKLHEFHHGRLGLQNNTKPDSATLYEIGSITKVFTGLMLAHEITTGSVTPDTPVAELLPDSWKIPSFNNKPIQLKHLATHTSRLPRLPQDLFRGADKNDPYAHYDSNRLRNSLAKLEISSAPGGKPHVYSNLGFGLLGHALANKNKTSYFKLLQKDWLAPLGMKSTYTTPPEGSKRAQGYDISHQVESHWQFDALSGAGAINSNLRDMMVFAKYCLKTESDILGKAMDLSMTPQIETKNGAQCLGWMRARDRNTYWHNGQTGGFSSYLAINRKFQVAVCVLSTGTSPHITALGEHLVRCSASNKVTPFPLTQPKTELTQQELNKLTGKYQLAPGFVFTVTTRNNRLFAQLTEQPFLEVFAESPTVFNYKAVKAKLEFKPGKSLTLTQNGIKQTARKLP